MRGAAGGAGERLALDVDAAGAGLVPLLERRALDHPVDGVRAPAAAVVEAAVEEDAMRRVGAEEVRVYQCGEVGAPLVDRRVQFGVVGRDPKVAAHLPRAAWPHRRKPAPVGGACSGGRRWRRNHQQCTATGDGRRGAAAAAVIVG